jgi:hypothetical protein
MVLTVAFSIARSTLKKKNELSMLLAMHGQYVIFIAALIWKKQFVPPVARPSLRNCSHEPLRRDAARALDIALAQRNTYLPALISTMAVPSGAKSTLAMPAPCSPTTTAAQLKSRAVLTKSSEPCTHPTTSSTQDAAQPTAAEAAEVWRVSACLSSAVRCRRVYFGRQAGRVHRRSPAAGPCRLHRSSQ